MKTNASWFRCIAALALGGCAGGEMSRFGEADGVFSTGESSGGGDDSPTTDPTAAEDGADGDPTTAPATDDGADESPTTTDPTAADSAADDESSSDDGSVEESSSDGGEVTTDPSTSSESSDGGDTALPDSVDLSGWTIVQTDSAREIELPAGTIVPLGGTLVIARNASPGAFQDFWGVNWGDDVVYIDGADSFPTINGAETYSLRDPDGNTIEGPTPPLELATVAARTDADASANDVDAWSVDIAPNSGSTPGVSAASGGVSGTPYISEYADPTGAGNFVYEYVEIGIAP